jgi:hypothetical protein
MADIIYNNFIDHLGEKLYDMPNDTFMMALLDDGHTPSAAHVDYADISGDELSNGNGYTTGGATLSSVTWTETGGVATFDAADVQWAGANFTSRYGVIYNTSVSNELVCLIDFTENKQASAITFEVRFDSNGIFNQAQA